MNLFWLTMSDFKIMLKPNHKPQENEIWHLKAAIGRTHQLSHFWLMATNISFARKVSFERY